MKTSWLTKLALALALGLGATALTAPALAEDGAAAEEGAEDGAQYEWKDTKIPKYNDWFAKADTPIGKVQGARENMATSKSEFYNAMGVADGTPIADALNQLAEAGGDKLVMGMEGDKPSLSYADDAPDNVKAGADAVNKMVDAMSSSSGDVSSASEDLAKMSGEAASMAAPKTIKTEIKAASLKMKDMPGALKATKANIDTLGKASGEAKSLAEEMGSFMSAVKSTFKEGELPAAEEGEGAEGDAAEGEAAPE